MSSRSPVIVYLALCVFAAPLTAFAMTIFVSPPTGTAVTLEVEPSDRIEVVKGKLEQQLGIGAADQTLIFTGTTLQNGLTLSECGIHENATLRLDVSTAALGGADAGNTGVTRPSGEGGAASDTIPAAAGSEIVQGTEGGVDAVPSRAPQHHPNGDAGSGGNDSESTVAKGGAEPIDSSSTQPEPISISVDGSSCSVHRSSPIPRPVTPVAILVWSAAGLLVSRRQRR